MTYTPPPPSDRATPRQMLILFGFGTVMTLFVMFALALSRGESMRVGVVLIVLGLAFGIGLVARNRVIEVVSTAILCLGAGVAIGLARVLESSLWYVGALFFIVCAMVVLFKRTIIGDRTQPSR